MATASLATLQAKALDSNTHHEGRMFYVCGRDRYRQIQRNNNYAPKTLKGNQRISSVPGQWGVVASRAGAARAFDICFVLDYMGAIPEHIGKILCLSDEHVVGYPDCADALGTSGVTLVFDDIEGGVFPGFPKKTLVDPSLIEYRDNPSSHWHKIIWKGEAPHAYVEYADKTALVEAYDAAINEIDKSLSQSKIKYWSFRNKAKLARTLSYGRDLAEGLEDFEAQLYPGRASRFDFPCEFVYKPNEEQAAHTVEKLLSPMDATLRIWSSTLRENGLALDFGSLELDNEEKMGRILETGRIFGIDFALSAHFDAGVPVEDILA